MSRLKRSFCCILAAVTLLTCGVFAESIALDETGLPPINTPYEYPVVPGTPEWVDLGSTAARVAACQVPEDILFRMTTQALAETALAYPYNICIETVDDIMAGVEGLAESSNAWSELMKRPDAFEVLDALTDSGIEILFADYTALCAMQYMCGEGLAPGDVLSSREYDFVHSSTVTLRNEIIFREGLCETPGGTPVKVWLQMKEWTDESREERDRFFSSLFPESIWIGNSCWRYNCFSYAFFNPSKDNQFMLTDVDSFFSDGGLRKVSSPEVGDYIVYLDTAGRPAHIGIVEGVSSGLVIVRSKWGKGPLMEHASYEVPSEYGNRIAYYREQ